MDPKVSTPVPEHDDPYDADCISEECPIYCCDPFDDDDDPFPFGQDDEAGIRPQHVERKRSENISILDGKLRLVSQNQPTII